MTKKICFVGLTNIMEMPYINKYIQIVDQNFDIIYWDRKLIDEEIKADNKFVMKLKMDVDDNLIKKMYGYIKFRVFASRILKENNYSGLIFLTGNTAVLLSKVILCKYKRKYILDIRDYFKENNKFYYEIQKKIINNSNKVVISSEAFKRFLPKYDYVLAHNTQTITKNEVSSFRSREVSKVEPIIISCIGTMRFFDEHKKVLNLFKNDERFLLKFIGSGSNLLLPYCEKNKIKNVIIQDRFEPEQTLSLYQDTNIILNVYGSNNPLVDKLLSNKLYFAAQLGIPILVSKDTFMEEVAVSNGFGFSFDFNNINILDELYSYYNEIKWESFYNKCDQFMNMVKEDESKFTKVVKEFLTFI